MTRVKLPCDHVWVFLDEGRHTRKDAKPCNDFDKRFIYNGVRFYCKYCRKVVLDEVSEE